MNDHEFLRVYDFVDRLRTPFLGVADVEDEASWRMVHYIMRSELEGYPVTMNAPENTCFAVEVARAISGRVDDNTPPLMGAEDFSYMLNERPGAYIFLGNGEGDHRLESYHGMGPCTLHNPNYDFNDALLPVGATYWVNMVQTFLAQA